MLIYRFLRFSIAETIFNGVKMIYFDNAATGGFKPTKSYEAAINAFKNINANPGRSGHRLSIAASAALYQARKSVAAFFNASSPERVVFSPSCTYALNAAIFGLYKKGTRVITTVTEHNSTLRPLYELKRLGLIDLTIVPPESSAICASDIEKALDDDVCLVCVNAVSNVTGAENDIEGIGKLLQNTKALFLVDGAQAAGHKPIDVENAHIDALCVPSHKGLLGIAGAGALILSSKAQQIRPTVFGGTGFDTFSHSMPENLPESLEAGTVNLPAVLSMKAGVDYLIGNVKYVSNQLKNLTDYFIGELSLRPFIKLYSIPNRSGITAFSHNDISSQALSEILSDKYDIATRGGFHCAPLYHKFLKTEKLGLLRASLSPQNTRKEINAFLFALDELSHSV